MSVSEAEATVAPANEATAELTKSLRRVQREMLELASTAHDREHLLHGLARLLHEYTRPSAMLYFAPQETGQWNAPLWLLPADREAVGDRLEKSLAAACQTACRIGEAEIRHQLSPARVVVAAPVPRRSAEPHALAIVYPVCDTTPHLLMLTQMVVSHIVLWDAQASRHVQEGESRDAGALVEMLEQIASQDDLRTACYELAAQVVSHLGCRRVAIGIRGTSGRLHVEAISGVSRFDSRAEGVGAWESAMDETLLRNGAIAWPPSANEPRHGALAHKALVAREEMRRVVSFPLIDTMERTVGVMVVMDDSARADEVEYLESVEKFLRIAGPSLGAALAAVQRHAGGPLQRALRTWRRLLTGWRSRAFGVATTALIAALFVPWPFRLNTDCRIEPVTRRYVAAPFEGILERSFVKPGDLVRSGDLLAQLDAREIRWRRAAVVADLNQARKKRDAAQAAHNFADQQIARLEMERLEVELRMLDQRAENLEIRSPIDGVIASGDLERAEGAPLKVGQTLFEVGPLERMVVELAVPDSEVSWAREGQQVQVRLDAYPGRTWSAAIQRIHPRSEIRDNENVFVAEAEIENEAGQLRPGMKGRARLAVGWRPAGWLLFHKPWEYLTKTVAW